MKTNKTPVAHNLYIHEEIMQAMANVQKKHDLTKTEVVAEMAQAIHIMLEMIEPSLQALNQYFERAENEPRI